MIAFPIILLCEKNWFIWFTIRETGFSIQMVSTVDFVNKTWVSFISLQLQLHLFIKCKYIYLVFLSGLLPEEEEKRKRNFN